jgi:YHS domain-containing protein
MSRLAIPAREVAPDASSTPARRGRQAARRIIMNTHMRKAFGLSALALSFTLAGVSSPALAVKHTGGEYNTLHAGLGAKGYDVVAYFTESKPVAGSDRFVTEYGGVKWQFANAANLAAFKSDPAKYAPQYGGFCSWGVSVGKLFDVDPVNGWKIVDGKLYLNFNADINNTFSKDPAGYISKANGHWSALNR